jgi:hypothetical protein
MRAPYKPSNEELVALIAVFEAENKAGAAKNLRESPGKKLNGQKAHRAATAHES